EPSRQSTVNSQQSSSAKPSLSTVDCRLLTSPKMETPSSTGLNPEQKEAVLHEKGPLLVLAGAGSGKTRVITHRLARLIEKGTAPRAILAVTFTNKAAGEMRERAQKLLGGGPLPSFIGTFHAWSLRLLRRYAAAAKVPPRFSIADSADQLALVKE